MRMPDVQSLDEYRAMYHRDKLWRPAVDEIRGRHGLREEPCRRGPDGTHIVYYCGRRVVKIFVPLFERDAQAESLVAPCVRGRLGVETPEVLAEGEVGGWRYMVQSRVPGRPVGDVWSRVSAADRRAIATTVGETIVRLRGLPLDGLTPLTVDWSAFVARQTETAAARQRSCDLRWDPDDEIPRYLESVPELLDDDFEPSLVLADITDEHVLVSSRAGSWRVTGYVDFGDAMVAHPDYEIVAPGLCIAKGDGDLLRTLLLAAGYPQEELGETFRRRLMSLTLLHRYVNLADLESVVPAARGAESLEDLARLLWPLC